MVVNFLHIFIALSAPSQTDDFDMVIITKLGIQNLNNFVSIIPMVGETTC